MNHHRYLKHFLRDTFVVVASVLAAVLLARAGVIENFLEATHGSLVLSSFLAGAFFTSIFTVAPAGVALVAIGEVFSPISVAFFGALGAFVVDHVVISFIRKDLVMDIDGFTHTTTFRKHLIKAFHFGFLKWAAFLFGMFLIATPLPDEAGLFLVGVSRVNSKALPFVLFLAHFVGIFLVLTIARAI